MANLLKAFLFALIAPCCLLQGQVMTISNSTETPLPGYGHNYIQDLSEIVNPANGGLSIRIKALEPKDRGAWGETAYAFSYDTPGGYSLQPIWVTPTFGAYRTGPDFIQSVFVYPPAGAGIGYWNVYGQPSVNGQPIISGGQLTSSQGFRSTPACSGCAETFTCTYVTNFVYTDTSGGRHPLGILYPIPTSSLSGGESDNCGFNDIYPVSIASDGIYSAYYDTSNYTLYVYDNHGDLVSSEGNSSVNAEDVNGNYENEAKGRYQEIYEAAYPSPGYNFVKTFSTLDATYQYQYPSQSVTPASPFNLNAVLVDALGGSGTCPTTFSSQYSNPTSSTESVVITIPGGLKYTLAFDPVTGYANNITYPTGATVSYVWAPNVKSERVLFLEVSDSDGCEYQYDLPAVQKRTVKFDGINEALEQSFSYTTNFDATGSTPWKETVVTTTDMLSPGHPSFQTIYDYVPGGEYVAPGSNDSQYSNTGIPLESLITYKGTSGEVLKSVRKTWWPNQTQLKGECTTVGSYTTGVFYQYAGAATVVTDKAEYDFGQISAASCVQPSTAPTRETITTYQAFNSSPRLPGGSYMFDRPCKVVINDHGSPVAETDYFYDNAPTTTVCGAAGTPSVTSVSSLTGHDETNYGPGSSTSRGNVTAIIKKCLQNCSQDSKTAYTYDEAGQVTSITDGCGNAPCIDMGGASHTATYSHSDNYSSDDGSPSANTDTDSYLTQVAMPSVNGAQITKTYQYGFNDGNLRSATDTNNHQITRYCYTTGGCSGSSFDPWFRLTGTGYPDGGQKIVTYVDGSQPSVKTITAQSITGTPGPIQNESIYDGFGHVFQTEFISDSSSTYSTYDGFGNVTSVTNPCRNSSDLTNGTTLFAYDALGRKIFQYAPDNTSAQACAASAGNGRTIVAQWCYNGIVSAGQTNCLSNKSSRVGSWVDYSDETGKHWQRVTDGLGRQVAVMEPDATGNPTIETDYTYNALDDLTQVNQHGLVRNFSYDSLSRLIASSNPEASSATHPAGLTCAGASGSNWTNCYNYDANGNLSSKIDNRGTIITYGYDALNRLLSKTYSDGTASSCYQYDTASTTNGIGRLGVQWTQPASAGACSTSATALTKKLILAYDPMGRVWNEQQCVNGSCTAPTVAPPCSNSFSGPYYLPNCYDLTGNLTYSTNGLVNTPGATAPLAFTNTFDAAGRLSSISSSWNDTMHPPCLFAAQATATSPCTQVGPQPAYAPQGGLLNVLYGNNLTQTRTYDNRLRVTGETDTTH